MRTQPARYLVFACAAVLAWTGCSATGSAGRGPDGGAHAEASEKDAATKRKALERKLAIAELELAHTKLEVEAQTKSATMAVQVAQEELGLAKAKHAQFQTLDMPNRIAASELGLQRARDSRAEAEEELKQLEIMYAEQDLQDMTAEFVISRGKRNAERAERSLAIRANEHDALKAHEMPRELRSLELELARKDNALQKAQADTEASRLKERIAVLRIEAEIADLREQLEKLAQKDGEE